MVAQMSLADRQLNDKYPRQQNSECNALEGQCLDGIFICLIVTSNMANGIYHLRCSP